MKKILLILVGGTICTAVNEKGTLSVFAGAGTQLTENFYRSGSKFTDGVEFVLTENLFILSENMTVKKWNLMIETYRKYLVKDTFDGVIFAHGTDTLAYSAALFSQLLSDSAVPVFFVSSNARLSSERANGNDNFRYAVECIVRGVAPNVYAIYKNISDGRMYLHLASRLTQCENYSDDFRSFGAIDITDINDENAVVYLEEIQKRYPPDARMSMIDIKTIPPLSDCVLMLTPYVGLRYDVIDYAKFSAVLHGTFHSGTACADIASDPHSALFMLDACAKEKVDVYLAPSKPEGEVYDTVRVIGTHGEEEYRVRFLYGYTNEMAYVKLLLAYSVLEESERETFIRTEQNFERIDQE